MKGINVELTWPEFTMAAIVGVWRQIASIKSNLQDVKGLHGEHGWTLHIEGACAEYAVAKAMGWFWSGSVNTFRNEADLCVNGMDIHVRRRRDDWWELPVRDRDVQNGLSGVYVLVVGIAPRLRVVGWEYAHLCPLPEYRKNPGGHGEAYFVPQHKLHDMQELTTLLCRTADSLTVP